MRAFAIYMGLALILAAAIILFVVRHNVEANSQQKVADHASFVAGTVIPKLIAEDAWNRPLSRSELAELNRSVEEDLLVKGGLEIRLYAPDGQLIYSSKSDPPSSSDASQSDPTLLRKVIDKDAVTEVSSAKGESGKQTKTIKALAPVTYPGSTAPAGIFLMHTDYGEAAGSVREQALPLAGFIVLIFVLLYLALLPILRRTTRQLSYTNDELRKRADDVNENLAQRAKIEQRLRETIADLERSETALAHSQEETIMRLSLAVETRDQETGDHIERMGRYCAMLAEKLGWSEERCELIRIAAPLHDVGKISVPDSILLKPGQLTPEERLEIEKHAEVGHEILSGSDSPLLDLAAKIALSHHEHWDGGGYPNGLAFNEIPAEGRMAAIADVFDALTSQRVYRDAMTVEQALAIMAEGRGTHFDPDLLDVFFDSMAEVLEIREGHSEERKQREQQNLGIRRRKRRREQVASATTDEDGQQHSLVG
jgi:HD-GYP domain-containing protein (c-di-GMP phosphodiesterase class II)